MKSISIITLCILMALPSVAQTLHSSDDAVQLVEKTLLPQGRDDVVLMVWGPVPGGTVVKGLKEQVMITPEDGFVVFIDDHPTANFFHPVRYAFVNTLSGQLISVNATSPPQNFLEYQQVETEIGNILAAVGNRRAPLPDDPPPPQRSNRWAVLMNGGISSWSNYPRYWNDLSNIYITLNWTYGFADDHIIVLCSDGLDPAPDQSNNQNSDPDLDGDSDDDIMFPCVYASVEAVFDSLGGILSEDDFLFVFATDHGSSNGGWNTSFNLWNNETLTDAQFAGMLDGLPNCTIVSTFEPCYSGGFLDDVVVPPGPRVASSACSYDQVSWAMPPNYEYDTYVFFWTAAVKGEDAYGNPVNADYNNDGIVTMDEAFFFADSADFSDEDPQYADEPRGIGEDISLWPSGPPPDMTLTLTPYGTPIQIPASGGEFEYNISATNNETTTVTFSCWCDATLPGGTLTDPVLGPISLELEAGQTLARDRIQSVPAAAPPGTYSFNAYVGLSPLMIWAQDSFTFEKLEAGGDATIRGWENWGESLDSGLTEAAGTPEQFEMYCAYPNPFNPTTTISYQLTGASLVNLVVYDISGRRISELVDGWRDAGMHEVTWDASALASGIYIYNLTTSDFTASGKMVLMK